MFQFGRPSHAYLDLARRCEKTSAKFSRENLLSSAGLADLEMWC